MTGSVFKSWKNLFILLAVVFATACSQDPLSSNNTDLSDLSISTAYLDQYFQSSQTEYTATVGYLATSVVVVPVTEDSNASVTVNGADSSSAGTRVLLTEGDNSVTVVVTAANGLDQQTYSIAIYRDTLAEFAQDAYVKSFNTEALDTFGLSVAVTQDILAIGAPKEDSGSTGINNPYDESADGAGAVYIFTRNYGTWVPEAYIKASNAESMDQFGSSVALSGNTLVVGAIGEASSTTGINSTPNNDAPYSGAVYVFTRDNDGIWTEQAYIKASNTGVDDGFGATLDLDGDTLAVGALNEDSTTSGINTTPTDASNLNNSGAVYVFVRDVNDNWTQQAYIKASNADAGDRFGSVSISGNTLAVGAFYEDSNTNGINSTPNNNGNDTGAVYIFTRDDQNTWTQQAFIKASNPDNLDYFGIVSLSGDSLAVGAPGEASDSTGINSTPNNNKNNTGAVYVFTRDNAVWTQQAYIKPDTIIAADVDINFGYSIALEGNALAVGAPGEDSGQLNSGAAYVFTRTNNNWTQNLYLRAADIDANDSYGRILSLSGDLLAVSAPYEDSNSFGVNDIYFNDGTANESGAVYIYQ